MIGAAELHTDSVHAHHTIPSCPYFQRFGTGDLVDSMLIDGPWVAGARICPAIIVAQLSEPGDYSTGD